MEVTSSLLFCLDILIFLTGRSLGNPKSLKGECFHFYDYYFNPFKGSIPIFNSLMPGANKNITHL